MTLQIRAVDAANWADCEALFARHGVLNGCWCQWWRLKRSEFDRLSRPAKRDLLRSAARSGRPIGLLAYDNDRSVGWIAVSPRADHPGLDRSPNLKPVDDQPAWSVTCFYVERAYRGQGLTVRLLKAAADYAREHGARLLEGYPVDTAGRRGDVGHVFPGLPSTFGKCGFAEVARRSPTRPIMRQALQPKRPTVRA